MKAWRPSWRRSRQVRLSKHKDGLKELAYSEDVGVSKSVPLDRLIALMGYEAKADEFDPKGDAKALEGLKKTDPYLFGTAEAQADDHPAGPDQSHLWRAVQSRGEARGLSTGAGITREQARDAAYVMEQAAIRRKEAAKGR